MLKVGVDMRFALGKYRGMGKFCRQLIKGREANLLLFAASGESDPVLPIIAKGHTFWPLWEQVSLPKLAKEFELDFLICPYNTAPLKLPCRLILVVHDLIYLDQSVASTSWYQTFGAIYRRRVVPKVIPKAHEIITVSEYTKGEIVKRFHISPETIRVIPNSLDDLWFQRVPSPADHERE